LGWHFFSKRENHEKCTNMILEALKENKIKMCAIICVCKHNGLYVQMHFFFLHLHEDDDGH
jgi:hypothetical protein